MSAPSKVSACSGRRMVRSLLVFVLFVTLSAMLQGQTYNVLYNFSQSPLGFGPVAGVTLDAGGNLYGTTTYGGNTQGQCSARSGCGSVYKLTHRTSGWMATLLYDFLGGQDGADPWARVVFGPDGTLYGTTYSGGGSGCNQGDDVGCGTVFNLRPPSHFCGSAVCPWTETVLYRFTGGADGANPAFGDLIFDQAGNIYGTTYQGGTNNDGTVYKLTRSGNTWTETVLHSFNGLQDGGRLPMGGVILVNGNLYGTTQCSGYEGMCIGGLVYELSPSGASFHGLASLGDYSWSFSEASLTPDGHGSFYGTTVSGGNGSCEDEDQGDYGCGVVFHGAVDSYFGNFPNSNPNAGVSGPAAPVSVDAAGNIYGTTSADGAYSAGNIFKLTFDGNNWTYQTLHDFGQPSNDGNSPSGNVAVGGDGSLYGTTYRGGQGCQQCGVVWQVTP